MKVLTGHDIRLIRRVLEDSGFDCVIHTGKNNEILLDLGWSGLDVDDRMNGLEIAMGLIREAVSGIGISFLASKSRVSCSLLVGC